MKLSRVWRENGQADLCCSGSLEQLASSWLRSVSVWAAAMEPQSEAEPGPEPQPEPEPETEQAPEPEAELEWPESSSSSSSEDEDEWGPGDEPEPEPEPAPSEVLAGIVRGGTPDLLPQFDYRYARRRCECRAVDCTT